VLKRRVVLTGATGFVGANLAYRLLRDGHDVHLLLRPSHQTWRLSEPGAGAMQRHMADLRNRDSLRTVLAPIQPDWVFHLAAYGAYPTETGIDRMIDTNLAGAAALLDVCAEIGVGAFVQTGTSSEYGYKQHAASELDILEPNSHYAVTKAAATHYCQFTARQRNIHAVTLRLYSIYGPYEQPSRLIPTLIVRALQGKLPPLVAPQTARDFVYVDDAVEAMIQVANSPSLPRGSTYNVCTGRQSTIETVVSLMRGILKVDAEPEWATMTQRAWDSEVWVGSPQALQKDLGWTAATSLETGLNRTIEWFRESPERLEFYRSRLAA